LEAFTTNYPIVFLSYFLTIIKQRIEQARVKKLPKINSIKLLANKLPRVFRAKKTTNTQMRISIALFVFPLLNSLYLINRTKTIKILIRMEKVSKDFISSTEFNLPAQTLS
jgi:hypothetical protein